MIRSLTIVLLLFFAGAAYGQGFPDAQKQPKQKEMHSQHRKYAKQARRRHIKRRTAFAPQHVFGFDHALICLLADDRKVVLSI